MAAAGRPWSIMRSLRRRNTTPVERLRLQRRRWSLYGCSGAPLEYCEIPAAPVHDAGGASMAAAGRPWSIVRSLRRRYTTPVERIRLQRGALGAL